MPLLTTLIGLTNFIGMPAVSLEGYHQVLVDKIAGYTVVIFVRRYGDAKCCALVFVTSFGLHSSLGYYLLTYQAFAAAVSK